MSENNDFKEFILPSETKHQIYLDVAQPAAIEVGKALQTICRTFNTIITPLKMLNDTVDVKYRSFINELEEKSKTIPVENICTPELSTVGPALMDLSFSLDEFEIRSMYMNLLLESIDNRNHQSSLRSFTNIIKQLSPFEARLLKLIYSRNGLCPAARIRVSCVPKLELSGQTILGRNFTTIVTNFSLDDATDETIDICLQNFLRLGLIELYPNDIDIRPNAYSYVEASQTYLNASKLLNTHCDELNLDYNRIDIKRFSFSLTSFGESFCTVCLD